MNTSIYLIALVSFLGSATSCVLVIATKVLHSKYTFDWDMKSGQKYHSVPVPRIGGLTVFLGLIVGTVVFGLKADEQLNLSLWAGVAAIPVFLGGIFEDVSKKITPQHRLALAFLSAAIATYELKIGLLSVGWPWFDNNLLALPGVALALTIFMVGGVAHSTNIIDGFNGLLLGFSLCVLGAFLWVAAKVSDHALVMYATIMVGSLLGFGIFNFPKGRIFLGDGGAYLIGFLLAVLSLLMVRRHPNISPWFPLLILSYPIVETLFSVVRKKMVSGGRAMVPDNYHLHMLVYEYLSKPVSYRLRINQNATTSVIMWMIAFTSIVPGLIWWESTPILILFLVLFCALYSAIYIWLFHKLSQNN